MLRIGTTGTETPFLSEGDLPECARQSAMLGGPSDMESEDHQLANALQKSAVESKMQANAKRAK